MSATSVSFSELNFWGRASTYFDLTPDISLETGISGLCNPNTNDRGGALVQPDGSTFTERERRLVGADLVLRYRPLRNNQFKSLTWGTELLYSDNRYDVNFTGTAPVSSQHRWLLWPVLVSRLQVPSAVDSRVPV